MAIISAGVIMNVIFAFLLAVVAFAVDGRADIALCGRRRAARRSGLAGWLRPGDEVVEIAGKEMKQFRDLQAAFRWATSIPEKGVPFRSGGRAWKKPLTIIVKPDRSLGAFFVGVTPPYTNHLSSQRKTWLIEKLQSTWLPGSPAALAEPPFRNGDKLVRIDDVPIEELCPNRGATDEDGR